MSLDQAFSLTQIIIKKLLLWIRIGGKSTTSLACTKWLCKPLKHWFGLNVLEWQTWSIFKFQITILSWADSSPLSNWMWVFVHLLTPSPFNMPFSSSWTSIALIQDFVSNLKQVGLGWSCPISPSQPYYMCHLKLLKQRWHI